MDDSAFAAQRTRTGVVAVDKLIAGTAIELLSRGALHGVRPGARTDEVLRVFGPHEGIGGNSRATLLKFGNLQCQFESNALNVIALKYWREGPFRFTFAPRLEGAPITLDIFMNTVRLHGVGMEIDPMMKPYMAEDEETWRACSALTRALFSEGVLDKVYAATDP